MIQLTQQELERLFSAAVAAPSADNSQPWSLAQHPEGLLVGLRPLSHPMFFDYAGWASEMSLGAAVENVLQVAGSLGLGGELRRHGSAAHRTILVKLTRVPKPQPTPLADVVFARHTNRFAYRQKSIEKERMGALAGSVGDLAGFRVIWAGEHGARDVVLRAVQAADWVRYTHPTIHADFHSLLRFGPEKDLLKDGLADDTLGIERILFPALRLMRPWALARTLNYLGLHHFMIWRGCTVPLSSAAEVGLLASAPGATGIECGRALQRVWLAAEAGGLAFQPMGALPLLLHRLINGGGNDLTPSHCRRLRAADGDLRRALGLDNRILVMIFRAGYPRNPVPRARRRALSTFLSD